MQTRLRDAGHLRHVFDAMGLGCGPSLAQADTLQVGPTGGGASDVSSACQLGLGEGQVGAHLLGRQQSWLIRVTRLGSDSFELA